MTSNSTVAAELAQSLFFEVEALPQDNVVKFSNTRNVTPLNVKIRVRKKDDENSIVRRGMISVPRIDIPGSSGRLRSATSELTIMSFNMLMEADLERKPLPPPPPPVTRKQKKKFFGMCLSGSKENEDSPDVPYTTAKDINSTSDNVMLKQHSVLSKNTANTSPSLSSRRKDKYFGKCKPGGCLDPPFGEDKYAYEPKQKTFEPGLKVHDVQRVPKDEQQKIYTISDKRETKKNERETNSTVKVVSQEDIKPSSLLSLYKGDPNAVLEQNESESIITYPPVLTSSGTVFEEEKQDKKLVKRIPVSRSSRKSFNEFSTTYFSPPKTPRESKENNKTGERRKSSYDPVTNEKVKDAPKSKSTKLQPSMYLQGTQNSEPEDKNETDNVNETKQEIGYPNTENRDSELNFIPLSLPVIRQDETKQLEKLQQNENSKSTENQSNKISPVNVLKMSKEADRTSKESYKPKRRSSSFLVDTDREDVQKKDSQNQDKIKQPNRIPPVNALRMGTEIDRSSMESYEPKRRISSSFGYDVDREDVQRIDNQNQDKTKQPDKISPVNVLRMGKEVDRTSMESYEQKRRSKTISLEIELESIKDEKAKLIDSAQPKIKLSDNKSEVSPFISSEKDEGDVHESQKNQEKQNDQDRLQSAIISHDQDQYRASLAQTQPDTKMKQINSLKSLPTDTDNDNLKDVPSDSRNQYDSLADQSKQLEKEKEMDSMRSVPPDIRRESLQGAIAASYQNQNKSELGASEQWDEQKGQKDLRSVSEENAYNLKKSDEDKNHRASLQKYSKSDGEEKKHSYASLGSNYQDKYNKYQTDEAGFIPQEPGATRVDNKDKQYTDDVRRSINQISSLHDNATVQSIEDANNRRESKDSHQNILHSDKGSIIIEDTDNQDETVKIIRSLEFEIDTSFENIPATYQKVSHNNCEEEQDNMGTKSQETGAPYLGDNKSFGSHKEEYVLKDNKDKTVRSTSPSTRELPLPKHDRDDGKRKTPDEQDVYSQSLPNMDLKKHSKILSMTGQFDDIRIKTRPTDYNLDDKLKKAEIKTKNSSILLDLALETYTDKTQVVVKSLDSSRNHDENKVLVVKGRMKPNDKGISIPINSNQVMQLKLQSASTSDLKNSQKQTSKYNKGKPGFESVSGVSLHELGSDINTTISSLFDQQLIPLHQLIKNLKDDIDVLASQQLYLNDRLGQGSKRLRSIRATHNIVNKKCGCLKKH